MSFRSSQPRIPTQNSRRDFLRIAGCATASLALPELAAAAVRELDKPVRLGLIADLHQDVMHDGPARLDAFLQAMRADPPDALVQLGDFAVPSEANLPLIKTFNEAHEQTLHVIGNHDVDGGFSFEQVVETWGMKDRYYTHDVGGLRLIVLDANETPPNHEGGVPFAYRTRAGGVAGQVADRSPGADANPQPSTVGRSLVDRQCRGDPETAKRRFGSRGPGCQRSHTHR